MRKKNVNGRPEKQVSAFASVVTKDKKEENVSNNKNTKKENQAFNACFP